MATALKELPSQFKSFKNEQNKKIKELDEKVKVLESENLNLKDRILKLETAKLSTDSSTEIITKMDASSSITPKITKETNQQIVNASNEAPILHSNKSLLVTLSNDSNKRVIQEQKVEYQTRFCFFCQIEDPDKLIACVNPQCNSAFCRKCFHTYAKNTRNNICQNCKWSFGNQESILAPSPSNKSKHSLSIVNNNIFESDIKVEKLDKFCVGYDSTSTIKINIFIKDGIQNDTQPKPGHYYIGAYKYLYLPRITESTEILHLLEKTLQNGKLFQVEFNPRDNEYHAVLHPSIVFKTQLSGGGRYGYPDQSYIGNLLRSLKILDFRKFI